MDIKHFIKEDGKVNSIRTRESYVLNNFPDLHKSILDHVERHQLKIRKYSEAMYYYFNDIKDTVRCSNSSCSNSTGFISMSSGHLKYCSSKCSNSDDSVKSKKIKKFNERYGVDNPFQAKEVKETIENTMVSRYGESNPMKVREIKDRMIRNNIRKNGIKWSLSKGGSAYNTKIEKNRSRFESKLKGIRLIEYSNLKNGVCKFECDKCSSVFEASKYLIHQRSNQDIDQCIRCNPLNSFNSSSYQNTISNFLDDLGISYESNNRKILNGLELDFYLPDYSIAIEINGLYWHSELFKDKNYHLNKTMKCNELGIRLIHIFEDELLNSIDIVKSRIKSLLGKSDMTIYARKCEIKEITSSQLEDFLRDNHTQGNVNSSIRLGLFHDDQLISVMSLGKLRKSLGYSSKSSQYELYRFCSILNTNVVGAAGKLLKHFINSNHPKLIVSYADMRWSNGGLYEKLGFSKMGNTQPNYWYINQTNRMHRFNFRKNILVSEGWDRNQTEHEIMLDRGIYRIYDCGSIKYQMIL
jgi:very-short-patch-repair endonuclease